MKFIKSLVLSITIFQIINSADLPEQEKKQSIEGVQKEVLTILDEAEFLGNIIQEIARTKDEDIYFSKIDYLPLGLAKNITKDESDACIIYWSSITDGYISCQYYKETNEYHCVIKKDNKIYRSKNGKQDFEAIQRMYQSENQIKTTAKL